MYARIQFLEKTAAESAAQQAIAEWLSAEVIAMAEKKADTIDFHRHSSARRVGYLNAEFVAEIVEQPYIVVADKPVYLYTTVGKTGQGAEKTYMPSGHYGAVLVPVVKNVAHQI